MAMTMKKKLRKKTNDIVRNLATLENFRKMLYCAILLLIYSCREETIILIESTVNINVNLVVRQKFWSFRKRRKEQFLGPNL